MRFIQAFDDFSLYRLPDGTFDAIEHGGLTRWRTDWHADRDTFQYVYEEWTLDMAAFQSFVRTVTRDRWATPLICRDCDEVDIEVHSAREEPVCETCIGNYAWCDRCADHHDESRYEVDGEGWCETCVENAATWCEECDVYYPDSSNEHNHDEDGCDCESPAQSFTIRNNGDPALANDERVTVSLPAGTISDEGRNEIVRYLRHEAYGAATIAWDLDARWQTRDGNYTKRLSRAYYKATGESLPPEVISQVGNIGRAHSGSVDHQVEVTRDLNLPPEEFAHEESCWWQSYFESRCALKSNGGFGLRSFDEDGDVNGRAWVMPMRMTNGELRPTFDSLTPDAFIVFNGYGALSGYTAARVMSYMAGMTYRKVRLHLVPMYINGDSGYLIAPEAIAQPFTDGSYSRTLDPHSALHNIEMSRPERDTDHKEMAHAC